MKKFILTAGLMVGAVWAVQAQFNPGNLAVLRAGNGTTEAVNKTNGNSVFIDQYTKAGSLVNFVTVSNSGPQALISEGANASEGGLTRSMDLTMLAITGYNTNLNTSGSFAPLDGQSAASLPRDIGTIDAFGHYQMVQIATGDFKNQNPRFAVTDGTNNFWAVGGASGIVYLNPTTSANSAISTTIVNNRALRIFNGNLYFSSQKSTPIGLWTFSSSPTSLQPVGLVNPGTPFTYWTNLLVAAPAGNISDFAVSPDGATVYLADTVLGIQKYTITGSLVTSNYTLPVASGSQPKGAFALAVDFSGANPIIYATTTETNPASAGNVGGNHLVQIVDTNSAAVFTNLAQAKTNQVFKGIDFTPDLRPQLVTQPQPQSQTVTFASPASITVAATSPYTLSYQWQQNGTNLTDNANISGSTTATLNFASAVSTNAGNYTVIITNQYSSQYGATTSSVAVLNVSVPTPPTITIQPTNQSDFIDGTASFTAAATGAPTPTYQWNEVVNGTAVTNVLAEGSSGANGELYTNTTEATLHIFNVQTNDSGNSYFVTASNPGGSTNSQNGVLTVQLVPASIISQPSAQATVPGQTVTFSVGASGSYLGYQWMYITNGVTNNLSDTTGSSGEIFSGTATSTLTITGVQTNDDGYYAVAVTNSVSATNSQQALLTVLVLPPPSAISYDAVGSVYTQNFDSLPNWGTAYTNSVKAANPVIINGTNYSFGFISQQFDFAAPILTNNLPGGLGLSNTMSGWYGWAQGVSGSNTNYFGATPGDQTTGGIQDYGSTNSFAASTNRALGLLTTGSFGPAAFAVRLTNNTASTLSNMNLSFTGELWRQSDLAKSLTFYYVVDPTGTNAFDTNPNDYVYLSSLDVNFPTNGAATGGVPVDGTAPANQINLSVMNQTMLTNWPPGAALWLVWSYTNTAGKAQGIAIDNLSFSVPSAVTAPAVVTLSASNITAGSAMLNATVNPNGGATAYWFQYSTNSASYDYSTSTNSLSAGSGQTIVSSLISNLLQGTKYYYQIVATNSVSTSSGAQSNFTTLAVTPPQLSATTLSGGSLHFTFTDAPGASFSVLATNNINAPKATWPVVGTAVENPAGSGNYQFTDPNPATNSTRFYILRQP